MAKREISSTLRNLKFMQRSALKEEKKKKIEEEPNGSFPSLGTAAKKCVVITDWEPQPGALLGRMSFQSFNPTIEKLNEEAISGGKTDASPASSSSNGGGRMSFSKPKKVETSRETNGGDLKRKHSEEQNHPSKSVRSSDKPSPSNRQGDGFKKPKNRKPQTKY
ncbi:Scarecrow-like transcription factor 11 [Hirschfeldia incana]|nr:Scarecrow-like transcription factor 11 [Hirschfeldia incana]